MSENQKESASPSGKSSSPKPNDDSEKTSAKQASSQAQLDGLLNNGGGDLPRGKGKDWVLNAAWWEWFEPRMLKMILFVICIGFSGAFLFYGLTLTTKTINSMITYRSDVSEAVSTVIDGSIKVEVKTAERQFVIPTVPESLGHAQQVHDASKNADLDLIKKYLDSSSLLSVSPIITLLAFLLGVGLTLVLGLMKSVMRPEGEIRNKEDDAESNLSVLATPLSKVFEEIIGFIKRKIK